MEGMALISIDQLENLILTNPNFKNGCLLDTNVLVAASLSIDPMNEAAEILVSKLAKLNIPLYSNVNIRSEFLEIHRRVLIPECLVEFYETQIHLEDMLAAKLKSVQTSYRKSLENKKVYKFSDDRIKEFRVLLSTRSINDINGWFYFCEKFLMPQLSVVWDEVVRLCSLHFIKIRDGEKHSLLMKQVLWDGVTDLMGKYGLSSADSMILNLFLSSRLSLVATADGDIQYIADEIRKQDKFILEI